jgi:hypothetical protein
MTEGDLHQNIAQLEAEIERLAEAAERCWKIMQASKAAIAVGALLLAAILFGFVRADPMPLFGSLAAIIGGIVVFGSNSSTAKQMAERIAAAEAERAQLIGGIDLRLVSDEDRNPVRVTADGFRDEGPRTLH